MVVSTEEHVTRRMLLHHVGWQGKTRPNRPSTGDGDPLVGSEGRPRKLPGAPAEAFGQGSAPGSCCRDVTIFHGESAQPRGGGYWLVSGEISLV